MLLDFPQAFDTVDHLILLNKLHSYHFMDCFISTNELQCTKVNGILSALECINRSIVRGSAIGPNTFSIYVADLKALGVTNTLCNMQMTLRY